MPTTTVHGLPPRLHAADGRFVRTPPDGFVLPEGGAYLSCQGADGTVHTFTAPGTVVRYVRRGGSFDHEETAFVVPD